MAIGFVARPSESRVGGSGNLSARSRRVERRRPRLLPLADEATAIQALFAARGVQLAPKLMEV
jgi:hypothetical protein